MILKRTHTEAAAYPPDRTSDAAAEVLAQFYRGFSGPFVPFDESLMEYLVVAHGHETVRSFLDLYREPLGRSSPSLRTFLEAAIGGPIPFEVVWSPAFGRVARCVSSNARDDQVCAAAAEMALRFASQGMSGCWSTSLATPVAFRIGRLVLPPARNVQLEAQPDRLDLSIDLSDGGSVEYLLYGGPLRWTMQTATGPFFADQEDDAVVFLTAGIAESHSHAYLGGSVLPSDGVAGAVEAHRRAMQLLDTCSPSYARWVRRLLRAVIPLETRTGGINSGSSRDEPGVIHASIDCPPEGYCEMLVHEVAHQHLYALSRLGEVDDGSDPTLYYSPVKETGRPIGMILLAYHAFANVILLGRSCRRHPLMVDSEYFQKNEPFLLPQVAMLEEGLRATRALTPLGRALWEPLAEELVATSRP